MAARHFLQMSCSAILLFFSFLYFCFDIIIKATKFYSCAPSGSDATFPVTLHKCLAQQAFLRQQDTRLKLKREQLRPVAVAPANCRNLFWIYWFQFHTSPLLMPAVSLCSSPSASTPVPKLPEFSRWKQKIFSLSFGFFCLIHWFI